MPAERLSMRKIKEFLRLKYELGLANRQIARSCSVNHSTVADDLSRAKAAGLDRWPLPDDLDEAGLGSAMVSSSSDGARADSSGSGLGSPLMTSCTARNMSRCNCFGRNTSSRIRRVTDTADSVNSIGDGLTSST